MATLFFAGGMAVWIANATPRVRVPLYPAFLFLGGAFVSLYMVFAPVFHWKPFPKPRDPIAVANALLYSVSAVTVSVTLFRSAHDRWYESSKKEEQESLWPKVVSANQDLEESTKALHDTIQEELGISEVLVLLVHGTRLTLNIPPSVTASGFFATWRVAETSMDWVATRVAQLTSGLPL